MKKNSCLRAFPLQAKTTVTQTTAGNAKVGTRKTKARQTMTISHKITPGFYLCTAPTSVRQTILLFASDLTRMELFKR